MPNLRSSSPSTLYRGASARRRVRRSTSAERVLFCRTNGCTTYMDLDRVSGLATCPICGAQARVH